MFSILTSRLLLRDFTTKDMPDVHAFRSDPQITRYMGFSPESLEQSRVWLNEVIFHNQKQPRKAYNLAVVHRTEGRVIGWIGIGDSSRYPTEGELGFGYMLHRSYWGRGYMTEALQTILDFGFRVLGAQRISDYCYAENHGSVRVMEKAGLRFERRYQDTDPITEEAAECLEYALLREEWQKTTGIDV